MANGDQQRPAGSDTAPQKKYLKKGYQAVGAAVVAAFLLEEFVDVTIGISEGFAPFAVIYIVAQAVERLIQPFTTFTVKAQDKSQAVSELAKTRGARTLALRAANLDLLDEKTDEAVEKEKELAQINADRAMTYWAAATAIALLICGLLGLGLIGSVATLSGPWWVDNLDVVITGIAIGAGTKPLHDLISFIQNKKQKTETAAGGAGA
ncbi:MAG TPA: hypothetical protein VLI94_07750 [Solirubrobacterales bacterium]|nr:hypothetical protein [Solirubrobacterales bacterium]